MYDLCGGKEGRQNPAFENLGKHLVLVLQEGLIEYMQREFQFAHIQAAKLGDPMHFHIYGLQPAEKDYRLQLTSRLSTDANGIASSLGLQTNANIELDLILALLESKISPKTILRI